MQSKFSIECSNARAAIFVPPAPLDAVRTAGQLRLRGQHGKVAAIALALVLGASGLAVAFGSQILNGINVSFSRTGMMTIHAPDMLSQGRPTKSQLQSVVDSASYSVIVPTGLPEGARLNTLMTTGHDIISLWFGWPSGRGSHGAATFMLSPRGAIDESQSESTVLNPELHTAKRGASLRWSVGSEDVLVTASSLTHAQLLRVKMAMAAAARRSGF